MDSRTGKRQWTPDEATHLVRQRVNRPVTVKEKAHHRPDPR
ncbi:DUF6192 family protein [Streptomyces sp. NPDC051664]